MPPAFRSDTRRLRCDTCQKDIPSSVGVTAEGRDYVWHFCGMSCYERWRQKLPPQAAAYLRQPSPAGNP